ncbi:MAG: imidazole glycerol phosphate synthase subunit HisH [Opitutae bacterium]
MLVIIDYGMGNLGSLKNMFRAIGQEVFIESCPSRISQAERIVLPGVGSFDAAMQSIHQIPDLSEVIKSKALEEKIPVLGICLGMQILLDSSEEGVMPGLGVIEGKVLRFPTSEGFKVPHMGWNVALPTNLGDRLFPDISKDAKYYFAHSYYARVKDPENSMMTTEYSLKFDSAICKENVLGVQFHPEKSHRFGMELLKFFLEYS